MKFTAHMLDVIGDSPFGAALSAAFTALTSSMRVEVINSGPETYQSDEVVAVNNGTDGTYYYYIDMNTYSRAGLQLVLDGGSGTVTATLQGTIQDDGTAAASCTYDGTDITIGGASSWTADALLLDDAGIFGCLHYLRIKIVANSGADDADWTILDKALY